MVSNDGRLRKTLLHDGIVRLFPAIDSMVLAREIPQSHLGIYPDSGHGFLYQYVGRFSEDVVRCLGED